MNYLTTWPPPDPSSPAPASAATGGSDAPVPHPGWCEAYDSLMIELVAGLTAGPAFLALLGPAGTGKTWLLHAAAACLRRRGQPAILVRRGELPIEVFPGTAVIVDEAARMDDRQLARLAAVRDASIVLADLPAFAVRLDQLARPPAIVPLAPLAPEDMPEFVAAWLGARGLPAGMLTHPAVARLFDHSGGVPRLVVQLLRAALAMHGGMAAASIGPDAVDEMAALRLGGFDAGTAQPAVQDAPHPSPVQPGVAQASPGMAGPGMAGEELAAADPAPPSEAPLSKAPAIPSPPEPAPAAHTPSAPPAGVSVQPRRRLRRAARAAVLPALAASLLMATALAVRHVPQAPSNRDTVLAASGTAPSAASAPHDAEIPAAGTMPGAQPPPARVPDAAPDAPVAIQAPPEAASTAPPTPSPSPSPAPTIEAVPAPAQEAAAAPSPAQTADPAPNPPEPPPPEAPAQAVIPPEPDEGRLAAAPSITVMAPPAVPSPPEPAPAPPSEAPEPQSLAQASGAPGLVLVAHAGDTMPALYAKVYRGVRPPPYPDVVAANHMPLRPGAIVVFPAPQDGWLGR